MANDRLVVPATKQPTFWNRDTAVGFFIGSFIASPLIGGAIGAAIGGFIGKSSMTQELRDGKVVKPPSFWNKSIIIGAGVASAAVTALGLAVVGVAALAGVTGALAATLVTGATVAIAAAPFIGAIVGGFNGKARMEREYSQAQTYVAENGNFTPGRSASVQASRTRAYQVSAEEAQLLETRLASKQGNFADKLQEQGLAQGVAAR